MLERLPFSSVFVLEGGGVEKEKQTLAMVVVREVDSGPDELEAAQLS